MLIENLSVHNTVFMRHGYDLYSISLSHFGGMDLYLNKLVGMGGKASVLLGFKDTVKRFFCLDNSVEYFVTNLAHDLHKLARAALSFLFRYRIKQRYGIGALPFRIGENVRIKKSCAANKVNRLEKAFLRLSGKSNHKVGRKLHPRDMLSEKLYRFKGVFTRISPSHKTKNGVRAGLH